MDIEFIGVANTESEDAEDPELDKEGRSLKDGQSLT